jgi:predicted ATPase
MLQETLHAYQQVVEQGEPLVFFDRGVLDLVAYDRRTETVSSPELRRAVESLVYHRMVFVAPPWEEIFCTDRERKQNFTEATAVYDSLVDIYQEFDFDLVILPKTSVPERIAFVLGKVEKYA